MFGNFHDRYAVILGTALAALPVTAEAIAEERAILVLDASGSMWGQVDGTPKITIARDVIQGLLGDWNPNVALGVTAYGHREKGNCADIETLVPVDAVDGERVMSAIGALNPKGKTPLTDAVRQAAETLKYTEERATVLLVSDGKETCNADPCAAAAELEANGIDFTVHVVGFDLTEEEKEQLQCVADNTGGKFLSADNAPELHAAMATTVQLVAEPEPEPAAPTGMKLTAVLAEGGEPVAARFDVKTAEQDLEGKRKLVERESSKPNEPAIVALEPGSYVVTATYGKAERSVEIPVEAGQMVEQTIVVPAGRLRLRAALTEGGDAVNARFDVKHIEQNIDGKRKPVGREHSKPGDPALFRLAEGAYFVTASYGAAERSFEMTVEADTLTEETLVIPAGNLRLAATASEGGEELDAQFRAFHAPRTFEGERRYVRGERALPGKPALLRLAEGRYVIQARYGEVEQEFEIEIEAGERTEKTVVLGAGHLRLKAVLAENGEPVRAHFQILPPEPDAQGHRTPIVNLSSGTESPSVTELPAGDYELVTRYDDARVSRDISIEAGELLDETIVLGAGQLHLSAVITEDGEPVGAKLRVRAAEPDLKGDHAMIAGKSSKPDQPVGFGLPAGDYLVEAIYGDAEVTGNVRVHAGEITEKVMVMNAGFLEAWGTRSEGGEPMHAHIAVLNAEPGPDGRHASVTGGYSKGHKNAAFALAAGSYLVKAKDGQGSYATKNVEIRPGERTTVEFVLPLVD